MFLLLTVTPLLLLSLIAFYYFSKTLEESAVDHTEQVATQLNQNVDHFLKDLSRLSLYPVYDTTVLDILIQHDLDIVQDYSSQQEKMSLFLSSLVFQRDELQGVQLFANDGRVYSHLHSSEVFSSVPVQEEEWYQDVKERGGSSVLLPPHTVNYYRSNDQENVTSVARSIREPLTNRELGVIKFDISEQFFSSLTDLLGEQGDTSVVLIDEFNEIIYNSHNLDKGLIFEAVDESAAKQTLAYGGENYLTLTHHASSSGIQTLSFIPESTIFKESNQLWTISLYLLAISVVIAVVSAFFSSNSLISPVKKLKNSMENVRRGHLEEKVSLRRNDEIGRLEEVFNDMVDEIQHLIREVYQKELNQKEAEYKALQSQIHPHFLYNTLESMNMMAISDNQWHLSQMITELASFLRYSMEHRSTFVTFREEIEMVRSYLSIMKVRMDERLRVEWDIDESVLDRELPKFFIQPLIENAIKHGISPNEEGGTIWISVKESPHGTSVQIHDDGSGMPEKKLNEIKNGLTVKQPYQHSTLTKHQGLGLWNTYQRFAHLYGNEEMKIEAISGFGTTVSFIIPDSEGGRFDVSGAGSGR